MATIAFISQKGGVGKSTLSRALAREIAANGLTVKIADLDSQQTTTADWHRLRMSQGISPSVAVQAYSTAAEALRESTNFDYFIVDAPARASKGTLELAKRADLVVQPTGASLDDLRPAVRVFHELSKAGIPVERLAFALSRIGTAAEEQDARSYLAASGYSVLSGALMEKPSYRAAQNQGKAITETKYPSLNALADKMIADIAARLSQPTEEIPHGQIRETQNFPTP